MHGFYGSASGRHKSNHFQTPLNSIRYSGMLFSLRNSLSKASTCCMIVYFEGVPSSLDCRAMVTAGPAAVLLMWALLNVSTITEGLGEHYIDQADITIPYACALTTGNVDRHHNYTCLQPCVLYNAS